MKRGGRERAIWLHTADEGGSPALFPPFPLCCVHGGGGGGGVGGGGAPPCLELCVPHTLTYGGGGGGHEKRGSALFPFPLVNGNKKTVSTSAIVYGDLSHTSQRMQRCMGVPRRANEEEQKWN